MNLTSAPHHDGSERFVPDGAPVMGSDVTVLLLQPYSAIGDVAIARCMNEGAARYFEGVLDRVNEEGCWWRFTLPFASPTFSYRFELRKAGIRAYVNGEGQHSFEPTDHTDFRFRSDAVAPNWARDSIVYQVYVDRFWRSRTAKPASVPLFRWTDPVRTDWPESAQQFYGGDLEGIRERLSHIEQLGASVLYLTPFFPSPESHRYSASSFEHVDPLAGGDESLVALTRDLHQRGMRCIGDLTLNHCSDQHPWFRIAVKDPNSPEAQLFHFLEHPSTYAAFMGIKSLPKLGYSSDTTHDRMYAGKRFVLRQWLAGPFNLDGWRILTNFCSGCVSVGFHGGY